MKIIILRHGESEGNSRNVITGTLNVGLTDKGAQQAKALSSKVAANLPTQIYVSQLKRTQQTWSAIASSLQAELSDPIKDSALNERDFGAMTGKDKDWLAESMGNNVYYDILRGEASAPGGESIEDVYKRSSVFLESLIKEGTNSDVIILVTHHHTFRSIICYLENLPLSEVATMRVPNASGYEYTLDREGRVTSKTGIGTR